MYLSRAVFFTFFVILQGHVFAQNGLDADPLWPSIEARLNQPGGDTARYFILFSVREHCGGDLNCASKTLGHAQAKLEQRFNLHAAVIVTGELAKVAAKIGNLNVEARAHRDLGRFYDAMGNTRLMIVHLQKSLQLYEKAGNSTDALRVKARIAEVRDSGGLPGAVAAEMEAVLEEAILLRDTTAANSIRIRLVIWTQRARQFDRMEVHVSALENAAQRQPKKSAEQGIALWAARGRADLFEVQGNPVEAERFFQKALNICQSMPDKWQEINILWKLAKLEWARKNPTVAKTWLDSALVKAERLQLHDLLAEIFETKAMFAEAEKKYAEALGFTQKKELHQQEFKKLGAGFSVESFLLEVEKERQAVELQLKNKLLYSFSAIAFLAALLATGFFIGLRKQRKARAELAAQNTVIREQSVVLKNLDAAKTRFFANVSHELRTPLTLLLGTISTMKTENRLTERQQKLLGIADRGGAELRRLIDEILALGKLEAGKMEPKLETTQLGDFFANYFAQFDSLAEQKGVRFSFEGRLDDRLTALIDREKCRQIVYNLLANAFKFTQAGGSVRGVLSIENSLLRLEVADTGEGIDADDLPHVFERYFQTNRPKAVAAGGTGIGLALCREFAELLGGGVEVKSVLGKGSQFFVHFPVKIVENEAFLNENLNEKSLDLTALGEPEKAVAPIFLTEKNELKKADNSRPTILVVEDNPDLRGYISLVLEEKYCVETAENGQKALEKLATERLPDLVLSDLMMPVMDGYELLENLKSEAATRDLPVVMLTARAEAKDRLKALRIGVDDYLTKPFEAEELLARLENLLKNKAARQAAAFEKSVEKGDAKGEKDVAVLTESDRVWLENFEKYVAENLSSDILTIPVLAQHFLMSESTLLRQLKRLTGLSSQQYLTEMRLDAARAILERGSGRTVAQIAAEVGYGDARSFARLFRERFGRSPSDFFR